MQSNIYGKKGEIIAVNYLKQKGYKILETNHKNKVGEIDIIAQDKDYLVFVEVNARLSRAFGDPLEIVDFRKQQKLTKVAQLYLILKHKTEAKCRFDVVSILGDENPKITHIENAFQ